MSRQLTSAEARTTKLKKGDQVMVTVGRSKGQTGTVERLDHKNDKIVVSNVNIYKRHQKASQENPEGGIIEKPMPLHISNVAFLDPKTKKATRLGYKLESGKKVRFAKASGSVLS